VSVLTLWDLLLRPIKDVFVRPLQADERAAPSPPASQRPADIEVKAQDRVVVDVPASPATRSLLRVRPGTPSVQAKPRKSPKPRRASAQDRYEEIVRLMLARYQIKVRKWRSSMSGIAWELTYRDGTVTRHLESPRPKSPMSMAIFLHEVGHHAIGFNRYKPRCLEEYHAWKFALETMAELGVPITDRVRNRVRRSLKYAVGKATRRGIKAVPPELMEYAA
jgi:hypothetical protein